MIGTAALIWYYTKSWLLYHTLLVMLIAFCVLDPTQWDIPLSHICRCCVCITTHRQPDASVVTQLSCSAHTTWLWSFTSPVLQQQHLRNGGGFRLKAGTVIFLFLYPLIITAFIKKRDEAQNNLDKAIIFDPHFFSIPILSLSNVPQVACVQTKRC